MIFVQYGLFDVEKSASYQLLLWVIGQAKNIPQLDQEYLSIHPRIFVNWAQNICQIWSLPLSLLPLSRLRKCVLWKQPPRASFFLSSGGVASIRYLLLLIGKILRSLVINSSLTISSYLSPSSVIISAICNTLVTQVVIFVMLIAHQCSLLL